MVRIPQRIGSAAVAFCMLAAWAGLSMPASGAETAPAVFEGEALVATAKVNAGRAVAQNMAAFGNAWRGNAQLFWTPGEPRTRLEVWVNVPAAGRYTVAGYFTKAPDYGAFDVGTGGTRIGSFNGFDPGGVVHAGRVALGQAELSAGPHVLVFVVTGKHPRSQGYYVGIDAVELAPVPDVQTMAPAPVTLPTVEPVQSTILPPVRLAPEPYIPKFLPGIRIVTRPTLRVWNGQGGEFWFYVDEAFIDWRTRDLNWWFEWQNAGPGDRAVWQVSRFKPPVTLTNWQEPPGIVAWGELTELPAGERRARFQIDFSEFAPKAPPDPSPPAPAPAGVRRLEMTAATGFRVGVRRDLAPVAGDEEVATAVRDARPAARATVSTVGAQPVTARLAMPQAMRLEHVALALAGNPWTYHVRVVVLDSAGNPTGAVSTTAIVHYGQPEPQDFTFYDPEDLPKPAPDPRQPEVTIVEYAPIRQKARDAHEWFVVTRDFPLLGWEEGDAVRLTPSKPGVWDKIGDAIGSVVDFAKDAVNWVATAYEDIKDGAVNAVASAIPGCGNPCKAVLNYGLDTGLTACGLPPDLPNFDELVEMGKGNLSAMLVEQAGLSDIPFSEELAEEMLDKVIQAATEKANHGPGGNQWLRPLPSKQYRPAFVRIRITNPPIAGRRDAAVTFHAWYLFRERYLPVPNLAPGETREVTLFLEPDYSHWVRTYIHEHDGSASSDSVMQSGWWDLYLEGEAEMLATATTWPRGQVNLFGGRPFEPGLFASEPLDLQPSEPYSAR